MNGSGPAGRNEERILSQAECERIAEQVAALARGGGETQTVLTSWWTGELRWGRNRVMLASDRRDVLVEVRRSLYGATGTAKTNQVDAKSLAGAVRAAERAAERGFSGGPNRSFTPPGPEQAMPRPAIWSDATYNLTAEARAAIARSLVEEAEAKGLLSAGYLEVRAGSWWQSINKVRCYVPYTQAQCSMTVRDSEGKGSGWAGLSSYDWAKIDAPALAKRALEKCVASRNPVALEPGRYTVVLEPQAVADLVETLVPAFDRPGNEGDPGCCETFQLEPRQSKLGLKVVDERLTLSHDPLDPELGIVPVPGLKPVTWIDRGVLVNLAYNWSYALNHLREDAPVQGPVLGYRLSGGTTSVEEMIATTQRGLLVTRFWDVQSGPGGASGLTRDGLWLIENGKVTKPVKNFRFVESPVVMLNQIEQLGVPVPVFRPVRGLEPSAQGGIDGSYIRPGDGPYGPPVLLRPAVVPPIKARDFSFTAMADAV